jgi:hypothetical protein
VLVNAVGVVALWPADPPNRALKSHIFLHREPLALALARLRDLNFDVFNAEAGQLVGVGGCRKYRHMRIRFNERSLSARRVSL